MKNRNLFLTVCFMSITAISFAQTQKATNLLVGDTSGAVEASAELEVESTTKGFLPPRMTSAQMAAIVSPAEGLIVYCTNCQPKGLYVGTGSGFGSVTGVADQTGVPASSVRSTTGKIWRDRNLGATQVATSATDEDAYGTLYQWGRNTDGHEIRTSTTASGPVSAGSEGSDMITVSSGDWLDANDETRWNGATKGTEDPCPAGFRVPTATEFQAEINAFPTSDGEGAFNSSLKLTVGGYRHFSSAILTLPGYRGTYWTSTGLGNVASHAAFNLGGTGSALISNPVKAYALSIRCIQE